MGMARTGTEGSNGSGDYVIAFSAASELRIRPMRRSSACSKTVASARTFHYGAFLGLSPRYHADHGLDADSSAERDHLVRNVSKYTVPRVLPPP